MQLNILSQDYYDDIPSQKLVGYLHKIFSDNDEVKVFYRFPLIKELDQEIRFPHILLISPYHGVVAFKCSSIEKDRGNNELDDLIDEISWIEDYIFSKLIKSSSRKIKKGKRDLAINLSSALFIPFYCEDANKNGLFGLYNIIVNNQGSFTITSGSASLMYLSNGQTRTFNKIPFLSYEKNSTIT